MRRQPVRPLIANARMYAVTPAAGAAWRALFARVAERTGIPLEPIDHAYPAPLEELWAREDLGAAFMCGYPLATLYPNHHPIAAPVPQAPDYGGGPTYCTRFVVRADSAVRTLADTFGHRFGYTVEHSHSGWNAPRFHLLRYRRPDRQRLFAAIRGPYVTPRRVLEAVLIGEIDVAPLDAYALDLMAREEPERTASIRIIESTNRAPVPLLVASPAVDAAIRERLSSAFLALTDDTAARPHLQALLLKGFARVERSDYDVLARQAHAAEEAGYSRIA